MTVAATSTLTDIRTKIRRLVAAPSSVQLTDQVISDYINTFYLYDFPEHLQTLTLRTTYEFYTIPFVDAYPFPREQYRNLQPPFFVAGQQCYYSQNREQFFIVFPQVEFIENVSVGNGGAGAYTFNLTNTPVQQGYTYQTTVEIVAPPAGGPGGAANLASRVLISAVDANGNPVIARDLPNPTATPTIGGFVDQNGNALVGTINYVTGAVTITFGAAIPVGNTITTSYISTVASRPTGALFYGDNIFLRPIPDNVYHVQIDAYMFPAQVLANTNTPQLREWWQYLAYGAAIKILIDRQDMQSVQNLMPFFQEQQRLINRRNIVQNTNERTASIYSEQVNYPYGNGFYRF